MKSLLLSLTCLLCCSLFSQTTYYSKSIGNLNTLATWGTNANGTGAAPANFTTANVTYIIVNNAAATISGNWTVSGANSKVLVGDGIQAINFTVPSPRSTTATFSVMVNSTLTASSGATISASTIHVDGTFDNGTNTSPTLGTISAGSTVKYSRAGNQTVLSATYANLQLNGSGNKSAGAANTTITSSLTISTGVTLILSNNNAVSWIMNGTITGAGDITGGNNSNITIGGSGTFGTLNFTAGAQTLYGFTINRAASGVITMGGSVTARNNFTLTNGILAIGANTLTFNGAVTFPVALANGSITGSANGNLSVNATAITNALFLTTGSQILNNLTVNCPGITLSLGTNLTLSGAFTHSRGIINLNGNTFTLNGTVSFSATAVNGTITGSATSGLIINATTIANSFFMTVGSNILNNFTLNSAAQNFTLGGGMTVSGAFTYSSGIFRLNGQALTLSGTIVFPASSANGTITGTIASDLIISASSITNNLAFTAGSTTLRNFTLNCGAQTVTLGSSLTVGGTLSHTTGTLAIGANTLTLNGTATFPTSLANGNIKGSASSNLSIAAGTITNSLYLTAGFETLNNFTLNSSGQTLKLGTNLTVGGTYTHTLGIVNINGQTLTLNGATTFASSVANGTTSGSAASNLILNSTAITNSFFMTVGSQTLNNFTLNSPGINFTMGTAMTVSGSFTHTSGIFRLNAQALTLNGTVIFPVASANGTMTGTNTSDLSISASSITNTLFFTAGALALRNLTFNSPAQTLTLGTNLTLSGAFTHTAGMLSLNGKTLTMNGVITFPASAANGSFTGSSTSSLSIGGAGAISNSLWMNQTGTGFYLNNFTLNRSGQTVTLANTLNLVGALTPTSGIFASGGNLILLASSSTVVARIGTMGASGSVTGNVTAQMYAKGGTTGWTHMSSPGLTGRTFSDWDDNTTITCTNCPDGSVVGGSPFTSVYWYDETVGGLYLNAARYMPIANISDAMTVGKGFWVFLGTSLTTTADILLDVQGPVNQGNFSVNLTETNAGGGTQAADHGYNLIANPYPSPILWTSLRNGNANVANAIYVYNPDLSGYATFVNGVSSPAVGAGGIGNSIPAGQAFYVKANAAAVTLTGLETNKGASAQELLKMGGQQTQSSSNPMVMRLNASGHNMQFETAIYFDGAATTNYDIEYDAQYMGPDVGHLGISTLLNGTEYAINGMPSLNQNYSIPVKVTTDTTGVYSIGATDLQNLPGGACLILHDNYTGQNKDLRTGAYSCTLMDTEKVAARFILNITVNPGLVVNSTFVNPTCSNILDGKLVAVPTGIGPWNYYWKDANSNIVKTSLNRGSADTLYTVGLGVYSVDVNTAGSCDNGTVTFNLSAANAASASFNPSATTVIFVADSIGVSFTNTSNNATSYWWDFGDGMGDANANQYHNYTTPGDYLVTLAAIGPCGDTSSTGQVISVVDAASVGIAAIAEPTQNMFISRDATGYYIQFNYKENTNAHISVQNILGEKIIADQNAHHVSNDKVYISLGENADKILIISVVTDAGEKTYCKILNY